MPSDPQRQITRERPGAVVLLADQSESTNRMWRGMGQSIASVVADAINRCLMNMVQKAVRPNEQGEEYVANYFHIGLLRYPAQNDERPEWVLGSSSGLVPISEIIGHEKLEKRSVKIPDGAGGLVDVDQDFAVWLTPISEGTTPMLEAIDAVHDVLRDWVERYPTSYPPIIINITDGEPTDGNLRQLIDACARLKALSTTVGSAIVLTCHVSPTQADPVAFPNATRKLPDRVADALLRASSRLPPDLVAAIQELGYPLESEPIGYVFGSDLPTLIQLLDVGTRRRAIALPQPG